jgi:hypothetical protein
VGDITHRISAIKTGRVREVMGQSALIPDRAALCKNEPLVLKCASPITCQIADVSHLRHYFFLPEAKVGCHPAVFWLGAAAIVLIFSFLGFLDSRLPFFSPLAMPISLSLMMTQ